MYQSTTNGLAGLANPPKPFQYAPDFRFGAPGIEGFHNTPPRLADPTNSDDERLLKKRPRKRSKQSKKHRSKSHKSHRKHRIGAYVLQIIGLVCLVMAAVKSFEPLIGAGFTLVLVGYNQTLKKEAVDDLIIPTKKYGDSEQSPKPKKERKQKRREEVVIKTSDSDTDVTLDFESDRD